MRFNATFEWDKRRVFTFLLVSIQHFNFRVGVSLPQGVFKLCKSCSVESQWDDKVSQPVFKQAQLEQGSKRLLRSRCYGRKYQATKLTSNICFLVGAMKAGFGQANLRSRESSGIPVISSVKMATRLLQDSLFKRK